VRDAPAPPRTPAFLLSADNPCTLKPQSLGTLQRVREAHDLLAAQLCAKHMKRTNSGHHVFTEQPQLVNGAVREVVEAVRKGCAAIPCSRVPPKTDPAIALPACAAGP
jgi:pimeloyl-ACP methyl ester carboxylesterase